MVTVLDVGLLGVFDIIFPVLLVFAILFSVLQKTAAITKNVSVNAIIAVSIAFLVLLSQTIIDMIKFMMPWFAVLILFLVLLLMVFKVFGAQDSDFWNAVKKDSTISWAILGIVVLIFVGAIGTTLGPSFLPATTGEIINTSTTIASGSVASGNFDQNIMATFFNPKILGLVVIFGVAIFAVLMLSGKQ